ncbi:MAG TPA: hypothetical protein VMA77_09630 [Solirubrobacteraceae bacterium]|nr:hypothetical protein [Solirubrobacteraceae bacterium]
MTALGVGTVADALADAGFTVVPDATPVTIADASPAERSEAVEATRRGETAVISVIRFPEAAAAIDAGALLGSDAVGRVIYFAAGPTLVVIEADDSEVAQEAYGVLTRAAHDLG